MIPVRLGSPTSGSRASRGCCGGPRDWDGADESLRAPLNVACLDLAKQLVEAIDGCRAPE